MDIDVNIADCSIILSYNFIYDEDKVKKITVNEKNKLPKIENLLSYADRLFTNNKIVNYKNQTVSLYIKGMIYELNIKDINILFFENKMAILYIKLVSNDFLDIEKLYKINKALTNFYTKKNDSYVYIGSNNSLLINHFSVAKFKQEVESLEKSEEIKKVLEENREINKIIFQNEYLKIKCIQKAEEKMIELEILKHNDSTKALFEKYYSFFNPHDKDKKAYPFSNTHEEFKGRVGFTCAEHKGIIEQNKNFNPENVSNRHYLYFENQKKLIDERKKENVFEFIHYDTFITSLILEYVKPNAGFEYYDTFNPKATSYVNSYITLTCDSEIIDREVKNNFVSFEPLISSKVVKGKKITNPDFFNIYQSQADIFTIGNSHNIVHIIDKDASSMKANKEEYHFFIYLLTCIQRNFILNIINSSIVNINNLEKNNFNLLKIKRTYSKLSNAVNNYNSYLTNVNFKVISNSSSADNSYNFFRECNEIDRLTTQWNSISIKFNDWKSILSHVLSQNPMIFVLAIVLFGLMIKLANNGADLLLKYLSDYIK